MEKEPKIKLNQNNEISILIEEVIYGKKETYSREEVINLITLAIKDVNEYRDGIKPSITLREWIKENLKK